MELAWVLSLRPEVRDARNHGGRCQRFDLHTQYAIMPSLAQDPNFDRRCFCNSARVTCSRLLIYFVDDFTLGSLSKTAHFSRKSEN